MSKAICCEPRCERLSFSRQRCKMHYTRFMKANPDATRLIPKVSARIEHKGARASWGAMMARCENPNHKEFPSYGGRGIRVCERWKHFMNFLTDMGERPEGTSIDRIDNDRGYEPGNCRWATPTEQTHNRRPYVSLKKLSSRSQYRGVTPQYRRWHATHRNKYLGSFATETEAAEEFLFAAIAAGEL